MVIDAVSPMPLLVARAWYPALVDIMLALRWQPVQFETATFGWSTATGDLISLICFHVDDMLMVFDTINHEKAAKTVIEEMQERVGSWSDLQKAPCDFG